MSSNDKNSKGDGGSGGSDDIIGGNKEKVGGRRRSSLAGMFSSSRRRSSSGGSSKLGETPSAQVNDWIDVKGFGIGKVLSFHKATLSAMPGVYDKHVVDFSLGGVYGVEKLHLKRRSDATTPEETVENETENRTLSPSSRRRRSTFSGLAYTICSEAKAESMQQALDMGFETKAKHDACIAMGFLTRSKFEHCLALGFNNKEDFDECFRRGFDNKADFEDCKRLGLASKKEYERHRVMEMDGIGQHQVWQEGKSPVRVSPPGRNEQREAVLDRATKKWLGRRRAAALRRWKKEVDVIKFKEKMIQRWRNRKSDASWRRWTREVQRKRSVERFLLRWLTASVAAGWRLWWRQIKLQRLAKRVLSNWLSRYVAGAWRHWWSDVEEYRLEKKRKKLEQEALVRRVQALEKRAKDEAKHRQKIEEELASKEQAMKRMQDALAQQEAQTAATLKQIEKEEKELLRRKREVDAKESGFASFMDMREAQEAGFTSKAPWDQFQKLGFCVKAEYDEYLEMGFDGDSRSDFEECLSLGLAGKSQYRRYKEHSFTSRQDFDAFELGGFKSKQEFEEGCKLGLSTQEELVDLKLETSARRNMRQLHRKSHKRSGFYCMINDIRLRKPGAGYDPNGSPPQVVLVRRPDPPLVVGKAVVNTETVWTKPAVSSTLGVGNTVRLEGRVGRVANIRSWCCPATYDVIFDEGESNMSINEEVRLTDMEIALVGSLHHLEFSDPSFFESLHAAEHSQTNGWTAPSFEIICSRGACTEPAQLEVLLSDPIVNCLCDEKVCVLDTSAEHYPGYRCVKFEGTISGIDTTTGLYKFRRDGQTAISSDFDPQANGIGEVLSVEPSPRYDVGTEIFVFQGANGGRWVPARIVAIDEEGEDQAAGRARHIIELTDTSEKWTGEQPIDLNRSNHGIRVDTDRISENGEWHFEANVESFFIKMSKKYGSVEDNITSMPIRLRSVPEYQLRSSLGDGSIVGARNLAKSMLHIERGEGGKLIYRQLVLGGEEDAGKTWACWQIITEIIDLQRHQATPPPDIPIYVSVQQLDKKKFFESNTGDPIQILNGFFECDEFSAAECVLLKQAFALRRLIVVLDGINEAAGHYKHIYCLIEALVNLGHRVIATYHSKIAVETHLEPTLSPLPLLYYEVMPLTFENRLNIVCDQLKRRLSASESKEEREFYEKLLTLRRPINLSKLEWVNIVDYFSNIGKSNNILTLVEEIVNDPIYMAMMITAAQQKGKYNWVPSTLLDLIETTLSTLTSRLTVKITLSLHRLAAKLHMSKQNTFRACDISAIDFNSDISTKKLLLESKPLLFKTIIWPNEGSLDCGMYRFSHAVIQEYFCAKQLAEDLNNFAAGAKVTDEMAYGDLFKSKDEALAFLNDPLNSRMIRLTAEELGDSRSLLSSILSSVTSGKGNGRLSLCNGLLQSWANFPTIFLSNHTVLFIDLSKCLKLGRSLGTNGLEQIISLLERTNVVEIDLSGSDLAGDISVLRKYDALGSRLRVLKLQGCARVTGDITIFSRTPQIRTLILYDTACYGNVDVFQTTPALEKLWLSGTRCSGYIQVFAHLKNLKVLGLQETNCEGSETQIRSALPRCSITYKFTPSGRKALPLYSPASIQRRAVLSSSASAISPISTTPMSAKWTSNRATNRKSASSTPFSTSKMSIFGRENGESVINATNTDASADARRRLNF